MNHLDLFSGIGGWALAARWAGIETIQFVERDAFCQKVLRKHWPEVHIHDDVKTFIANSNVDIITASMPCQPFSSAGKKKGKKDERYMWEHTLRIIQESKPAWFLTENVVPFLELALNDIIIDLEREGYDTRTFVLPACAANAPHRRDRVWLIANAHGKRSNLGLDNWKERYIQENAIRNMEKIQSEWSQLKPNSWETNQARDWLDYNAGVARADDGISAKLDRCKALGNAIVPQIAYVFLAIIKSIG